MDVSFHDAETGLGEKFGMSLFLSYSGIGLQDTGRLAMVDGKHTSRT